MDKKRLRRQFILDTMDPNHQELVRVFTELMQSPFRNFFPLSKFAEPMANGKLKIKESPSTFLQEAKAFLAATEMRGFNRRDFLKTLGYSAGALTLWSNEAEANPMMTFFANSGNKAREIANAVTY
ncbi:MAG: twin-arginine translocation signal domain-containing protein, partial [Pseudobdellovibrionaceae bacterium]